MLSFTIITPTLQRKSLIETCESVNAQEVQWQHIVMVDCADLNRPILDAIAHPQRTIIQCSNPHKNGGNSCRHNAYPFITGDLVIYLDDDNTLADHRVLADIGFAMESAQMPAWGIFPILRLGSVFYSDPPRSCHTDTLNMVFRHDHALWPDTDAYGSDGVMLEGLIACDVPYAAFPDFRPIAVLPKISFGKED
jgi:glycosyltransferase involved in cell wall biosynthesis